MRKATKRILKRIVITVFSTIGLFLTMGAGFLYSSPQFGKATTEKQQLEFAKTGHYADGVFINTEEIKMVINCKDLIEFGNEIVSPDPNTAPQKDIKVQKIAVENIVNKSDSLTRITWMGHSTFLIEMDGKNILLDPVFGKYAAPHPWLVKERFNSEMPITIEELPHIDAIIISHDHYDHLDYPSIQKLKSKTSKFYVPLGVGNHLVYWGIPKENIVEMNWWQETKFESIHIAFAPSRHMSGRRMTDHSATLWGSWVLKGQYKSIYFSGDGGYGKHFKEIGQKYGPFDIGLMECGQYNRKWEGAHMYPEETVQAGLDVQAKMIMPIHWGAFGLAPHSWTEPIERVTKRASELNLPITTPQIGEPVVLNKENHPNSKWWETFN